MVRLSAALVALFVSSVTSVALQRENSVIHTLGSNHKVVRTMKMSTRDHRGKIFEGISETSWLDLSTTPDGSRQDKCHNIEAYCNKMSNVGQKIEPRSQVPPTVPKAVTTAAVRVENLRSVRITVLRKLCGLRLRPVYTQGISSKLDLKRRA